MAWVSLVFQKSQPNNDTDAIARNYGTGRAAYVGSLRMSKNLGMSAIMN